MKLKNLRKENKIMKKIYYEHISITSVDQDDVEKEINSYIKEAGNINIISLNVIPEKWSTAFIEGYAIPKYCYHISMVYTCEDE